MRRRLILSTLVIASIALLSLYVREGEGSGPLHQMQTKALAVTGPLQDGASRAVQPFRDLGTWAVGVWDARSDLSEARRELSEARAQQAEIDALRLQNDELRRLTGIELAVYPRGYDQVAASVVRRLLTVYSQIMVINRGSNDGVRVGDPVVDGVALVGRVESVSPGEAVVQLLTDPDAAVAARVLPSEERWRADDAARADNDPRRETRSVDGVVVPSSGGDPNVLFMQFGSKELGAAKGEFVVTAGLRLDPDTQSWYPQGVPIGRVVQSFISQEAYLSIQIRPLADLDSLNAVYVLTGGRPDVDGEEAQAP